MAETNEHNKVDMNAEIKKWEKFLQSRSNVGLVTMMYMQMQDNGNRNGVITGENNDVEGNGGDVKGEGSPEGSANGNKADEQGNCNFNCIAAYWNKNWRRLHVCYLLSLVLIAQLMIPALLFSYSIINNEVTSFCPNTADGITRAVALAVGCIYQARIILVMGSKRIKSVRPREGYNSVWLTRSLNLDSIMNMSYEVGVYFINVWIVFSMSSDPLDMVLNALALEFVLKLDDFAKKHYIAIFGAEQHFALIQRYDDTFDLTNPSQAEQNCCDILNYYFIRVVKYFLPLLVFVYIPWCKP